MTSKEIRQRFLDYFAGNDHRVVPSSGLVPIDDPTLLFTNAGMNQFKNVFTGAEKRDYVRAASCQKCMRVSGKHNDLEEVGPSPYHQTFFEMLGNFSFGDYFKRDAIRFAWEFVTEELGLPPEQLYATVHHTDDEACDIWAEVAPYLKAHGRIKRFGDKDNFWAMGDIGPCGPCSEIHFDRGEDFEGELNVSGDRYLELWNLVFMQFLRDASGDITPLPKPSVDTGAGLERLALVVQGVRSNYETDLFRPIIGRIVEVAGKPYRNGPQGVPHRVIADHVRAISFSIADGAMPSNEGRGYVVRRILRRAAYHGRLLDVHRPFLADILPALIDIMGDVYPELIEKKEHIINVITAEEESFGRTLDRGLELFEQVAEKAEQMGRVISGRDAFKLYDTYGFPLDLTQVMARRRDLTVDEAGFAAELDAQKERSRQAAQFSGNPDEQSGPVSSGMPPTVFTGYDRIEDQGTVLYAGTDRIILDRTPFYAESGGQVGDVGIISCKGFRFEVDNTIKEGEVIVHLGKVLEGDPSRIEGKKVSARVDIGRRLFIMRNHTATHLLHRALRKVLGDHVHQAGSLVAPDRLRFDFTHYRAVTDDEMFQIECEVNERILEDLPVLPEDEVPFHEAKKKGAIALFGEKYGDTVRVVRIAAPENLPREGEFISQELCGGTHCGRTGEIGQFRIVSESAVAAGVRRIEAVTGMGAYELMTRDRKALTRTARRFKASVDEVEERLDRLFDEQKALQKQLKELSALKFRFDAAELVKRSAKENRAGIRTLIEKVDFSDRKALMDFAEAVQGEIGSGVIVLFAVIKDAIAIVTAVTGDLVKRGIKAGDLAKQIAQSAGGSGGGKPSLAQGGVKDVSMLESVLFVAKTTLEEIAPRD